MKRSWLKRGKEWLARKVPMKRKNEKRAKERHADAFGPPGFVEFVHSYGCVLAKEQASYTKGSHTCDGPVEAAHVHGRSRGWKENIVGLCRGAHTMAPGSFHHLGSAAAFDKRWNTDLDLWAAAIYSRWLAVTQSDPSTWRAE